jgi:hypothetical protein
MHSLAGELLQLLREEAAVLGTLLSMAGPEREALLSFELEEIRRFHAQKEAVLRELQTLEKKRAAMLPPLAEALKLPRPEVSLAQVCRLCPEPLAGELRSLSIELSGLSARIREESARTRAFCRHGLETLQGSFWALRQLVATGPTYQRSGKLHDGGQRGRLVLDSY